jgi:pyrroline-5-carboxylate reductase
MLNGETLLLVGGGRMGMALLHGWLGAGLAPSQILVQEPTPSDALKAAGVGLNPTPEQIKAHAPSIIILAVKPQIIETVLPPLGLDMPHGAMVLSLMAGVPVKTMAHLLGDKLAYVRTMPNTPASIGKGMTGLYATAHISEAQKQAAAALLGAVGQTVWLDNEKMIDAVTAISGSGPAYVFHLVEAMQAAGQSLGLPEDTSRQLAMQTIIGAAAMLQEDGAEAAQLRRNVTSPGGTTEAALDVLMSENGLSDLMRRAAQAATNRAQDLAQIGAVETDA